jgi:hypothetical protein
MLTGRRDTVPLRGFVQRMIRRRSRRLGRLSGGSTRAFYLQKTPFRPTGPPTSPRGLGVDLKKSSPSNPESLPNEVQINEIGATLLGPSSQF